MHLSHFSVETFKQKHLLIIADGIASSVFRSFFFHELLGKFQIQRTSIQRRLHNGFNNILHPVISWIQVFSFHCRFSWENFCVKDLFLVLYPVSLMCILIRLCVLQLLYKRSRLDSYVLVSSCDILSESRTNNGLVISCT